MCFQEHFPVPRSDMGSLHQDFELNDDMELVTNYILSAEGNIFSPYASESTTQPTISSAPTLSQEVSSTISSDVAHDYDESSEFALLENGHDVHLQQICYGMVSGIHSPYTMLAPALLKAA